jgi:hypothetical protein
LSDGSKNDGLISMQRLSSLFGVGRLRFSLRALLLLIAAGACWLGYHLYWIEQRHAFLMEHAGRYPSTAFSREPRNTWGPALFPCSAPGALPLFGEKGIAVLSIVIRGDYQEQMARAQRLFPEATVLPVFLCSTIDLEQNESLRNKRRLVRRPRI